MRPYLTSPLSPFSSFALDAEFFAPDFLVAELFIPELFAAQLFDPDLITCQYIHHIDHLQLVLLFV